MELQAMQVAGVTVGGVLVMGVGACAKWLRSIDKQMLKLGEGLKFHFGVEHPNLTARIDRLDDRVTRHCNGKLS